MSAKRLLDLFCGAGGAARGYADAGFEIVGVDIEDQPHYPFHFIKYDALEFIDKWTPYSFDAIHASPPCQAYTKARKLQGKPHPKLIEPTRERLIDSGLPYVIENVPGAPLVNPTLLCGAMFDLLVYRHRLFETNFPLPFALHSHGRKQAKMGRPPRDGEVIQVVGHMSNVPYARRAMGIDWMTQTELAQAIPPAFTRHIGEQLLAHLGVAA